MSADEKGRPQAIVCRGKGATALEPLTAAPPCEGEMLLRLRAVGFCGTDLFKLKTDSAPPGAVLGHEVVGTVEAVGAAVSKFKVGDRVVVPHHVACGACALCRAGSETMCPTFKENLMHPGGFADLILIAARATEQAAFVIPDHVPDEAAVFVEPAACVLRGVERAEMAPDGAAVVIGAGSMGLLHLLVLKAVLPGITVIMTDLDDDRLEISKRLGADAAVKPGAEAEDTVKALTGGWGADAIFDTVGGNATLQTGLSLSRAGGTVVLFAHAPEGMEAQFDLNTLFKHERRIIGTYSGSLREQRRVFELICDGALDPSALVTHQLALDAFEEGVDLVVQQKALKVLFTPSRAAAQGAA